MEPGETPYGWLSLPLALEEEAAGPHGMLSVPGTGEVGVAARKGCGLEGNEGARAWLGA